MAIRHARRFVDWNAPIALPAFSCFDVASAAIGADEAARFSFYDLDPGNLAPDLSSLRRVMDAGARVVVVAPLYGVPVDWSDLDSLVNGYGGFLIEDAAQGHGAAWNGQALGALGRMSTLSFGRGKGWTGGNGGAVLLRGFRPPVAEMSEPDLGSDAQTAVGLIAQWGLARPSAYAIPLMIPGLRLGETVYRRPKPVTQLSRVAAATLVASHPAAKREAAARRANAERLREIVGAASGVRLIRPPGNGVAGYLRLPLLVANRNQWFGKAGLRTLGIAAGYPMTLTSLPGVAGKLVGPEARWPGAEALVRDLVTLPTHSRLEERDFIAIQGVFRGD